MASVGLGFRVHLGWAAAVALGGDARSPRVLARERLSFEDPGVPETREPFHRAAELRGGERAAWVARGERAAAKLARRGLRSLLTGLEREGGNVVGATVLLSAGRQPADLEAALASHAAIHTAEGNLVRDLLRTACESFDLEVHGVRERDLDAACEAELRVVGAALERRVNELGQDLGPPWQRDQKAATRAAWLALVRAGTRR